MKNILYRKNECWDQVAIKKFNKKSVNKAIKKYALKKKINTEEFKFDIVEHFSHNEKVIVCFAIVKIEKKD